MRRPAAYRRALALLSVALVLGSVSAARAQVQSIVVVEDQGDLFDPPRPLPFAGQRIEFVPTLEGGYETHVDAGYPPTARGARLEFPLLGPPSVHVALSRPLQLFDQLYSDIYVHPHGAVSFGAPLPEKALASGSGSDELISNLLSGPPVVAALWNELDVRTASLQPQGGVYAGELPDRVVITWLDVPSVRPTQEPNTFRIVLHRSGRIWLEYLRMASTWGVVGVSPGASRLGTDMIDLADQPHVQPARAALAWYRDRPRLNEIAVARRVYAALPDRFEFLSVFTDRVVDGPSLVGSLTLANQETGIGMPLFDHRSVFGTRRLEHMILMNSLDFYDDNPRAPPDIPGYARTPSTLAVLAHETGHRWLAHMQQPFTPPGHDGHWNYFLDSDGSFMGGGDLEANPDGSFTSVQAMSRFGPLDQYLMGLVGPEAVDPFFVVEDADDLVLANASGRRGAYPESGISFRGKRRDLSIEDVITSLGPREPAATRMPRVFHMAFVLVTAAGAQPDQADIQKIDRIRQAFGPFMRKATNGRATMRTWLWRRPAPATPVPTLLLAGSPSVLNGGTRNREDGALVAWLDFADLEGDLVRLEVSSDASEELPPAQVDVVPGAFGSRRGTVSFTLRNVPEGAETIHVELIDAEGNRSPTLSLALPT